MKNKSRFHEFLLFAVFLPLAFGCGDMEMSGKNTSNEDPASTQEAQKQTIAQINNKIISRGDMKSYLLYKRLTRRMPITEEAVKERLDEMIVNEVLLQEGLRSGILNDPTIRRSIQQIVSKKLIEDNVNKQVRTRRIDEKEIQEYYEQHKYEFDHPEQVRVADIFVAVAPDSTREQRTELKNKAEAALAEALKSKNNRYIFRQLIKKYSDTHTKYPLGDTGYFDADGNPIGLNSKLTEDAFKLSRRESLCDHVIETPDGFHVIMLFGTRRAVHKTLNDVKKEIKGRIRRTELENSRQAYIDGLKKKAEIHINDEAMAKIVKALKEERAKQHSLKNKRMPRPGNMGARPPMPGQLH